MKETVYLSVRYPGDFKIDSEGRLLLIEGRIDEGTAFPFCVPKKISFVDLYDKLKKKLRIDSNLYEMVLRCPNPCSSKYPPYVINDDDTVEWLISKGEETCLHVNLMKLNANGVGGTNRRAMPMHNGGEDMNCVANDNVMDDDTNWQLEPEISMHDDVALSPLVGVIETVGVGVDVSDILLATVDDSCLIPPIETSPEGENMIEVCADSLSDGSNDIAPTGVTEADNVIPTSSDIPHAVLWRIPSDEDVHEEDEFPTKDDLIWKMKALAIAFHFEFERPYSDKTRIEFKCAKKVCSWRLRAACIGSSSKKFVVRVYESDHSCPLVIHHTFHKQADSNFVCSNIEEKFQDSTRPYRPKEIISDFHSGFGHKVTYSVAYNAQKKAKESIRGTPSENFRSLPKFFHSLEVANPDTKTYIETDPNSNVFKYCFMALGQCIRGYSSSILPVICVDGTFLPGAYRGTLLEAVGHDGQRGLYPLAFAIVKSETNDSWAWFFEKLKLITGDTSELVILSDRAPSIKNGFEKVFKNAHYGNCCLHMKKNLLSKYPKCKLSYLFKKAYKAYTVQEFEEFFGLLCKKVKKTVTAKDGKGKDSDIDKYLPANEFRFWSRAHFHGHRYHHMTTNPAESFNSRLKKVRGFPVVALLKEIRSTLQEWFSKRNEEAQIMNGVLTPIMQDKMKKRYQQMRDAKLTAKVIRQGVKYEVLTEQKSFVVNFETLTCTCRGFDLKKFPCIHALCAVCAMEEIPRTFESLCSKYHYSSYYKAAYSESIYPPVNENEIEYPDSVLMREVVPPPMENGKGRPATNRKKGAGDPRGAGEKSKRKKAKPPEVQPGETSNEPHEHTLVSEEQPRDHGKNKRKKAKQCRGSEEQPGETSNKPHEHTVAPEEQPGETSNEPHEHTVAPEEQPREPRKKKPKKYRSVDSLISRGP